MEGLLGIQEYQESATHYLFLGELTMQLLLHTGAAQANEELIAFTSDTLSYEEKRDRDGRELTTRRHAFEVIGARPNDNGVEITVRFNLTQTLGLQYEDGRQKWAKGHFQISPDMAGYADLAKYAEKTIGRTFKGGALQYEAGSGLNYSLMPSLKDGGYVTFDVESAGEVEIDGQVSEQYVVCDLWFENVTFIAPLGELEVQRPVKRGNPLAAPVATVSPAAPVRPRTPIQVPAALKR